MGVTSCHRAGGGGGIGADLANTWRLGFQLAQGWCVPGGLGREGSQAAPGSLGPAVRKHRPAGEREARHALVIPGRSERPSQVR